MPRFFVGLRRALLASFMLASGLAGQGCATGDGMTEKLYDTTRAYNRSLRWGDWDRAAEHLPRASADAFIESHQAVEDELVVIDYRMTRLEIDKQGGVAASQAEIDWHTKRDLVVRSTTVEHLWQWHGGRWVLVDERRSSGRPLSIFAEVQEGDAHPWLPGLEAYRDQNAIGLEPAEKRKREREQRKSDEQGPREDGIYSLDDLHSMPSQRRPASLN
ncbi:hypothetical protein G6O69_09320 [Pseudenhygromyxa sp. WMMC2535]|uniref:hypothetical protein n=1 Tax=Pseudenhygromyxa sp. WMMC2535 TaxID=2712867 RepID=UPI0015548EBC|nr:hypothetical protein [Pseudenhygromyxa sp. WMMC2535]NVB38031.1 hypothetical protein [Pseudenhygromyxa sp. WMMC2535]